MGSGSKGAGEHALIFSDIFVNLDIPPHLAASINRCDIKLRGPNGAEIEVAEDAGGGVDELLEGAAGGAEGEPVAGGEVGGGVLEDEVVGEQGEQGALRGRGVARGGVVGGDTHGMPAFASPGGFEAGLGAEGVWCGCRRQLRRAGMGVRWLWAVAGQRGSCLSWSVRFGVWRFVWMGSRGFRGTLSTGVGG